MDKYTNITTHKQHKAVVLSVECSLWNIYNCADGSSNDCGVNLLQCTDCDLLWNTTFHSCYMFYLLLSSLLCSDTIFLFMLSFSSNLNFCNFCHNLHPLCLSCWNLFVPCYWIPLVIILWRNSNCSLLPKTDTCVFFSLNIFSYIKNSMQADEQSHKNVLPFCFCCLMCLAWCRVRLSAMPLALQSHTKRGKLAPNLYTAATFKRGWSGATDRDSECESTRWRRGGDRWQNGEKLRFTTFGETKTWCHTAEFTSPYLSLWFTFNW